MTSDAWELPTYGEATGTVDCWAIVAPYVPPSAYTSLCLTSSKLYGHFAARLWNNPLRAVQFLGLDRNDELRWYLHQFIGRSVSISRASTRALVLTLDFRNFGVATADFLSDEVVEALNGTLRRCQALFPALRCLLLDYHPVFDPGALARASPQGEQQGQSQQGPLLLSIAGHSAELQATYLASGYMRSLVYLDISYLPGSLWSALSQWALGPLTLPALRVLKVRGREVDNRTAVKLATRFMRQLWSLDLGNNRLTEDGLVDLLRCCLPSRSFQSDAHFSVEGKLEVIRSTALNEYGPYVFITESDHSGTHSHPDRYLADAPTYESRADGAQEQNEPGTTQRPDGTARVLGNEPDNLIYYLTRGPGGDPTGALLANVLASRPCQGFMGLSHLAVDGNRIELNGLQKAIRMSNGALEHLDCDMLMMRPPPESLLAKWLSPLTRICGFIGGSHLLRPVVSSRLRSARMHHSLVTQVPTLLSLEQRAPFLADTWAAEEVLLPGVELAYTPNGAFAPDMNPRLTSLTLTNLPRRSTGRLIRKLTRFLELAYEQERAILDMAAALPASRRSPTLLGGLQRLRLEFEPDLIEELDCYPDDEDEAALVDDVKDMSKDAPPAKFSFFDSWGPKKVASSSSRPQAGRRGVEAGEASDVPTRTAKGFTDLTPGEIFVAADGSGEYVTRHIIWKEFQEKAVDVWIGPGAGVTSPHPAVNEYVRMQEENPPLRNGYLGIGPVTPAQVAAGAPSGAYIFQWAWEAMIWRDVRGARCPRRGDLERMQDVLPELKRFRQLTRTSGKHWGGSLEVVTKFKPVFFEAW